MGKTKIALFTESLVFYTCMHMYILYINPCTSIHALCVIGCALAKIQALIAFVFAMVVAHLLPIIYCDGQYHCHRCSTWSGFWFG